MLRYRAAWEAVRWSLANSQAVFGNMTGAAATPLRRWGPRPRFRNRPACQQCRLEAHPTLCRLRMEYELRIQVSSRFADPRERWC